MYCNLQGFVLMEEHARYYGWGMDALDLVSFRT